uniref:Uncharacterized protein n=1 Tax=Arundo donax TaxID=35708 RepID=A0A0A9DM29_ARUDO
MSSYWCMRASSMALTDKNYMPMPLGKEVLYTHDTMSRGGIRYKRKGLVVDLGACCTVSIFSKL